MSALPHSDDFRLRDAVLAALESDEPNPHRIAERIAEALPVEHLRDVVRRTLPQYVSGVIHSQRAGRNLRQSESAQAKASQRWQLAAQHQESGELELHRLRVCPGGEWKLLRDCAIRDVRTLAMERRDLADKNRAWSKRFDELAGHMQKHEIPVVAGVAADDLRRLFDGS